MFQTNESMQAFGAAHGPGGKEQDGPTPGPNDTGNQADAAPFDAAWYLAAYPDVALSGLPPHEHYLRFGRLMNRQPSAHGTCSALPIGNACLQSTTVEAASSGAKAAPSRRATVTLRGGFNLPGTDVPLIRGWLASIGDEQPRSAYVQIGSTHALEVVCNGFRTDLLENGVNKGHHGFELVLPIQLIDGKPYSIKLVDKTTGRIVAEESAAWVQERSFRDFSGFLENSFVSPLVYAPFREEDKRCFALMENIADDLAKLAQNLENAPLVSVIMPVHNRISTVEESVASVLQQTYRHIELVVIDDGSTDGTHALLEDLQRKDGRIVLLRSENCRGVSFVRNLGLAQAKGELLCYLDSDNSWDERYVAATVGAFRRLPDALGIFSGQLLYRGASRSPFAVRFGSFNRGLLENRNYIDLNAFAHTRRAIESSGNFDETLARFVDWDFILRMAETVRMYSVPVLLSHYYFDKADNTLTNAAHLHAQLDSVRSAMLQRRDAADELAIRKKAKTKTGSSRKHCREVSIVIPSYEALADLKECIESIHSRQSELRVRIVVVDNASSKPVQDYLAYESGKGRLKFLRNPHNYGFTRAVNQGLELAGLEDDVLLLNNDAVLAPSALDSLHEAAYDLPECGLVAPRQILYGGTRTISEHVPYASPEHDCDVNLSRHHSNVVNPTVFHHGEHTELSFAPFFCVYIKREVLGMAPRLDEKHGRHYRSDRIYCDYIRMVMGMKIYHVSRALVYHKLQRSTDHLQQADAQGNAEFKEICIHNTWGEELARQLGYRTPAWDRPASENSRY